MHKCLRVFSRDGIGYETIKDPTEQDILRTIEAITKRVQAGVECIYAILDREDHCYTQLAAEEDGYHVEWREWGESFVHWWAKGIDEDEWITQAEAIRIFLAFLHKQSKPSGFYWFNMNSQLEQSEPPDGEIQEFEP
ncbi:MAG: hypothetical protein IT422_29430 [Pirellulaceae bacterium]|jgi:hypothetical protein|nr:hypothetical protein [Pirellulaceae bacterium]